MKKTTTAAPEKDTATEIAKKDIIEYEVICEEQIPYALIIRRASG